LRLDAGSDQLPDPSSEQVAEAELTMGIGGKCQEDDEKATDEQDESRILFMSTLQCCPKIESVFNLAKFEIGFDRISWFHKVWLQWICNCSAVRT